MTFLVTLRFHLVHPLKVQGCLDQLAGILATIKMKTCNPSISEVWTFYIGFNGHWSRWVLLKCDKDKLTVPKSHNFHTMMICIIICLVVLELFEINYSKKLSNNHKPMGMYFCGPRREDFAFNISILIEFKLACTSPSMHLSTLYFFTTTWGVKHCPDTDIREQQSVWSLPCNLGQSPFICHHLAINLQSVGVAVVLW